MMPDTRNPFSSARIVGKNVNPADYHKQDVKRGDPAFVMSRGELMEFDHCPQRWLAGVQTKETGSTEWGTLIDGLLTMSPEQFDECFAIAPEMYPCEATKKDPRTEKPWNYQATYCDEWRKARLAEGKIPVKHTDWIDGKQAVERLLADEAIRHLFETSDRQVQAIAEYKDERTGVVVQVKTLLDLVPRVGESDFDRCLADFKTARSAERRAWRLSVFEHDYHVQAMVYMDAFNAAVGAEDYRTDFLHPIQESVSPWQPGKRFLSEEFRIMGRLKYTNALRRYCECLKTNKWPGYETYPHGLNLHGFEICEPEEWMTGR
jgi:hypothetical protein